jgi:SAM-dependent methyltransferase
MNPGLPTSHPSIAYYDGDYPGEATSPFPENLDATLVVQGLAHDVERYLQLAAGREGPVLELCCGTGRVAIPLARAGLEVVGVDISPAMLRRFRENLDREDAAVRRRIRLVEADATALDLQTRFSLIVLAFNSLLCIPSFEGQLQALAVIAAHLEAAGLVALDLMNPLTLPLQGDTTPKPFFTRRNPRTGWTYTRFAAMGPMAEDQVQELFGWYDEIDPEGVVRRTPYAMRWRPVFRYELALMLERVGLVPVAIEGGHRREPFTAASPKMFVVATAG